MIPLQDHYPCMANQSNEPGTRVMPLTYRSMKPKNIRQFLFKNLHQMTCFAKDALHTDTQLRNVQKRAQLSPLLNSSVHAHQKRSGRSWMHILEIEKKHMRDTSTLIREDAS